MAKEAGKVISLREEIGQAPSLDDRIADAFICIMSSSEVADLLREVQETSEAAKAESKAASAVALDPRLRPADVAHARQNMQDADFRSTRLDAAADELQVLLDQIKTREESAARQQAHTAAIAERDQLVKDLAAYERHSQAIVDLLLRIAASNAKLHMDEHAERIARGAEPHWNVRHDATLPKLIEGVRLPRFRRDGSNSGYVWPPHSTY